MREWLAELRLYLCNHFVCKVPFHTLRLAFYRRVMQFAIGEGSSIHMGAFFDQPHRLTVGTNSTINSRCRIDTRGGIHIGDNVSISTEVVLLTADHDLHSRDFAGRSRPIRINDHVFIGTRAIVLPGVTLGRGSAVAAGAVVTREVPPGIIVAGSPARPIGERSGPFDYSVEYRRIFS